MLANDFVRYGSAGHRHFLHVAASSIDSLANCFGNFVGFAGGKSNFALTIANGDESVEGEATASLHYFGNAVDRDHVFDELASAFVAVLTASAFTSALSVARAALAAITSAATLTAASAALATATAATLATATATATTAATLS
jgi:hypothetical protein